MFARKKDISIIIISQSYFSGGEGGRQLRNNVDCIVLLENNGDAGLNARIMQKLGYFRQYKLAASVYSNPHSYLIVNCSAKIPNQLRVASNLFDEQHKYIEFYV